MKALDLSFSAASREWCAARKAEGWELLIVNLWTGASTPSPARANLVNARAAGMLTAGYTVVNMTPATAVNKAALAAGTEWEHLAFVSVDVEIATTPAIIRQAVDSLRTLGKKACIYTGGWFWGGVTGDFSDVPAWLADYDGNPAMDTARLGRLGPVIGKQYKNSHDIGGVTVDANTFSDSFIGGDMALSEADKAEVAQMIVAQFHARMRHDAAQFRDEVNHLIRAANIPRDEAAAALKAIVDGHAGDAAKHAGGGVSEERVAEIIRELVAD